MPTEQLPLAPVEVFFFLRDVYGQLIPYLEDQESSSNIIKLLKLKSIPQTEKKKKSIVIIVATIYFTHNTVWHTTNCFM